MLHDVALEQREADAGEGGVVAGYVEVFGGLKVGKGEVGKLGVVVELDVVCCFEDDVFCGLEGGVADC